MVHSGIFAASDEIITKAGKSYDTGVTEARINALCLQAEAYINATTKYNWSDAYGSLNADVKGLLALAESNLVAIYILSYNLGSYNSQREAETMLDVLRDGLDSAIRLLKEENVKDFMEDA